MTTTTINIQKAHQLAWERIVSPGFFTGSKWSIQSLNNNTVHVVMLDENSGDALSQGDFITSQSVALAADHMGLTGAELANISTELGDKVLSFSVLMIDEDD